MIHHQSRSNWRNGGGSIIDAFGLMLIWGLTLALIGALFVGYLGEVRGILTVSRHANESVDDMTPRGLIL
jgi:hypothetical protein